MNETVLLHNPRCSKCRAATALLEEAGVAFEERRYLERPMTVAELEELQRLLGRAPREWCRSSESAYAEAGLNARSTDAEVLRAMAQHPILIERPIFVHAGKAVIGRPPENILTLFS